MPIPPSSVLSGAAAQFKAPPVLSLMSEITIGRWLNIDSATRWRNWEHPAKHSMNVITSSRPPIYRERRASTSIAPWHQSMHTFQANHWRLRLRRLDCWRWRWASTLLGFHLWRHCYDAIAAMPTRHKGLRVLLGNGQNCDNLHGNHGWWYSWLKSMK